MIQPGGEAAEERRLGSLRRARLLDSLPERVFDDLVAVAAALFGVPIALVSLVDQDRQWFKARVGLGIDETPRSQSFCAHAIESPGAPMVVTDARRDPRFADNPLVTGEPGIRFYAGAPVVLGDGSAIGTLCVIDRQPREADPAALDMLMALARTAASFIDLRTRLLQSQRRMAEQEMKTAALVKYQRRLESRNAELQEEAFRDALTGLLNRNALERIGASSGDHAWLQTGAFSLAIIDLDHFKRINDTLGHAAGDEVLKAVGEEILRAVRGSDLAVRYGGEEFLVLMPSTPLDGARSVIERIRRSLSARGDLPTKVTLSAGLAAGEPGRDDPDAVFERADQALYRAKRLGRNRVEIAED